MLGLFLLAILQDWFFFALVALGVYASSQVGKFVSFASLSTPFLAAAVACKLGAFIPWYVSLVVAVALVSVGASLVPTLLNERGGVDRLTAGLVTYFLALGLAYLLATNGQAKRPFSPGPGGLAALLWYGISALIVFAFIGYFMGTPLGLRLKAFSLRPELAARFGFPQTRVYFPALLIGEAVVALAGVLRLQVEGVAESTFPLVPALIGIAASSLIDFGLPRSRPLTKLSCLLILVLLWRLVFILITRVSVSQQWDGDLNHAMMATIVAVCAVLFVQVRKKLEAREAGP